MSAFVCGCEFDPHCPSNHEAAARRFLALTETGPDYEAAKREFLRLFPSKAPTYDLEDRMLVGEVIKPTVDAALADYLTEEET